jgi:predicted GNAT family acetyltransferase
MVHTEVDLAQEGKGLASTLVRGALDDIRARGGVIVPLCPYVIGFLRRHPDYEDLVDRDMTERIDTPR